MAEDQYVQDNERQNFCAECGEPSIVACPSCETVILHERRRPAYCGVCGKPFPWTETAIQAAFEFTDELDALDSQDKSGLKAAVPDLVSDTARTPLAISRVQTLFAKIGKPAAQTLSQILVSVLTEEAKRQLGLK